jgi:L-fucose isomerase-like protein
VQVKVKPVHIVGSTWHVFPQPDYQLKVTTEIDASQSSVEDLHRQLRERLKSDPAFLEPALIREEADLASLERDLGEADVLLVNLSGGLVVHHSGSTGGGLWNWDIPIIAFSGERTPMMGLYALPIAEREKHPNVTFALDAKEVDDRIRVLRVEKVQKKLADSRVVIVGEYRCAEILPDPDLVKRKLGVGFVPLSSAEFLEEVSRVEEAAAEALAKDWTRNASGTAEPSTTEVLEGARIYLALETVLQEARAHAVSVSCLEVMYAHSRAPFCFALAALRDVGRPAGCEADAGATLTMLMLEYLADRPAYMGNLVQADPDGNLVSISHGCSPARIAGRDQPPKPYKLVHSHSAPPFSRDSAGGSGVTSYVDYGDEGQEVTIARMGADVGGLLTARAKIVACRDTICDRTTLTVQVADARKFVQQATGNHQVVVYGDYVAELRELCRLLDMKLIEA